MPACGRSEPIFHLRPSARRPASSPRLPTRPPACRDGRYALFVAADIAVYEAGPARPTGGVGAVACLVGPRAPLRLVPRSRYSHAVDVYDFYKPSMGSEYPAVDGKLSQVCYLKAVDDCYNGHMDRAAAAGLLRPGADKPHGLPTIDSAFDHMLFHSPYNKLVQQSFRCVVVGAARSAAQCRLPSDGRLHVCVCLPALSAPATASLPAHRNAQLPPAVAAA